MTKQNVDSAISYSIDIVNLSKRFQRATRTNGYTTIKSSILNIFSNKSKEDPATSTLAVNNVTMRVPQGASLGVIGKNGSGKSTLLKLITGIYKPDSGRVQVNGRIAALIELGAGFHPDFTGRENLMLGGVMHGLTRAEITSRLDKIIDFAELRHVIDDPVRTYSSGMYMRLGFSLAIHTEPNVLLVDEVLAVGDASFVAKCRDKLAELRRSNTTLLLVTHDLDAVERWCDEVVWLNKGVVMDRGEPRRVIDKYLTFIEHEAEEELLSASQESEMGEGNSAKVDAESSSTSLSPERWGSREIEITQVKIVDPAGGSKLLFHPDDPFHIEISYKKHESVPNVVFGVAFHRADGLQMHGSNTDIERISVEPAAEGRLVYKVDRIGFAEGQYSLDVAAHRQDGYPYDYRRNIQIFGVRSPFSQVGVCVPAHTWAIS